MPLITSDLYKEAIKKSTKTTFIDGEINPISGSPILIKNEIIDPGSLYITNQCVNNDALELGAVFSAELGLTIKSEIDRHKLYNAGIELYYNILLSDDTYEKIPLGKFTISEPARIGRDIVIKAYDDMLKLDNELPESLSGTPYELLLYISARCNILLAQTQAEIEALVNGTKLLDVVAERIMSYRELLSYICQVTCTFAIFNRQGLLQLYEYDSEISRTIEAKERISSKFSDFETYFSGAKAGFLFNGSYKTYIQADINEGIIYDLGNVPIVQGLDDTNQATILNIANKLTSIRYTPCDITFSGDPSIELGDLIQNIDRHGNTMSSLVTYYKWSYRGRHQIKSAGQNPKLLKIQGQSSKEIAIIKEDLAAKDMIVYTYTNSSKVKIQGGGDEEVTKLKSFVNISLSSIREAMCIAMITIPLTMSSESDVEFHQLLDGEEMFGGIIAQRCHEGKNVISFVNYFTTKSNSIHKYSIVGLTKGIDDNDSGEMIIEPYLMKAIIFGQGLGSVPPWDGIISVSDVISDISVKRYEITIADYSDELDIIDYPVIPHTMETSIPDIQVNSKISVIGLTDEIEVDFDV